MRACGVSAQLAFLPFWARFLLGRGRGARPAAFAFAPLLYALLTTA
jgi:hypothetical protein